MSDDVKDDKTVAAAPTLGGTAPVKETSTPATEAETEALAREAANKAAPEAPLTDEPTMEDKLAMLKTKADTLGVKYGPRIGVDALRAKIDLKMNPPAPEEEADEYGDEPEEDDEEVIVVKEPKKSRAQIEIERKAELRQEMVKKQMKLVRVRIANMNSTKKDLGGEIFSVTNKYLGTVKMFVPYGEATDDGWHVPFVIFNQLKARKFLNVTTKRVKGQIVATQRWVPEFSLEVMEPLNPEELKRLANSQAAAAGMGS